MIPYNQEMDMQFFSKLTDNPSQAQTRASYNTLYYVIESLPKGPEHSVAKRKLLESLDAALRCQAQ